MKQLEQLYRVYRVVEDGRWHSLAAIGRRIKAPTQSVSARLRDLRKKSYGGHKIDRRPYKKVYLYRLG